MIKTTFSGSVECPLYTGLTVCWLYLDCYYLLIDIFQSIVIQTEWGNLLYLDELVARIFFVPMSLDRMAVGFVCRSAPFLFTLYNLSLLAYSTGVQHILCGVLFVFVLYTLCCQFLWIVHFWLPLRYSITCISQIEWGNLHYYGNFRCTYFLCSDIKPANCIYHIWKTETLAYV